MLAIIADKTTSTPLYLSLHTADPGRAGSQKTNEVSYDSYARVLVASDSGWNVSDDVATLAEDVDFPASTGGATEIITHFAVGIAPSGIGEIICSGPLVIPKPIAIGDTPTLLAFTQITKE